MTPEEIRRLPFASLIDMGEFDCCCGKRHGSGIRHVVIQSGAVQKLPELLAELGSKKPFLLSGKATFAAAGDRVTGALEGAGVPYGQYVFPQSPVVPAEQAVGAAVMHFDDSCDAVIGIGSGVINDIGKLLAKVSGRPYLIVGTAPSMDGYASATSSMECDGLKVSLDSTFAWAIIGDLEILCQAPLHMLQAGGGERLAKSLSLVDGRIARLLVGEYYCPTVSAQVESGLEKVVGAAPGLVRREPEAVKSVMEGLVIAGIAMKYAGLSRPASGMEHYFSHIWDLRALAFEEARADLHGIQCGIATLLSLKVYQYIRSLEPDREAALKAVAGFSAEDWNQSLRDFIGPGAEAMIQGEKREGKYDREKHALRLEKILEKWGEICAIIDTLPSYEQAAGILSAIGAPVEAKDLGYTAQQLRTTFTMTKDIRDKYIASRLLWDLGRLEDAAAVIP